MDGTLSAAERTALDQRLRLEPALNRDFDRLQQTRTVLRAAPVLTPPHDFTLDPARFGRNSQRQPVRLRRWPLLATLAAAVLIVFAVSVLLRPSGNGNTGVLVAAKPSLIAAVMASPVKTATPATRLAATALPAIVPRPASPLPSASPFPPTPQAISAAQQNNGAVVMPPTSSSSANNQSAGAASNQDGSSSAMQPNLSAPALPSSGAINAPTSGLTLPNASNALPATSDALSAAGALWLIGHLPAVLQLLLRLLLRGLL